MDLNNPYFGNILIDCLPPIPNPDETLKHLTKSPIVPKEINDIGPHIRLHYLTQTMEGFNIPSLEGCRLSSSIDLMIRHGYSSQNPNKPNTWKTLFDGRLSLRPPPNISSNSASVAGHSGVGKTQAILLALNYYDQIYNHKTFPNIMENHYQMCWQSVEVPGSGKLEDFMSAVMRNWDLSLQYHFPNIQPRFTTILSSRNRDGARMYEEWLQVARSHFLGILHIDEVQNFFNLPSIRQRQTLKNRGRLELKIVEDKLLKTILNLCNSGLPILISGTPDGMAAFTNRFSTAQRSSKFGYHEFKRFESSEDHEYIIFVEQLMKYQFVRKPLTDLKKLSELLLKLTAGIKRLIRIIWVEAHRHAYLRGKEELLLEDFVVAEEQSLKHLRPAVKALLSNDPNQLKQYTDLLGNI